MKDCLIDLGVRHIRDGGGPGVHVDARNKFLDLYKSGIDVQYVMELGIYPYASACNNIFPCVDQVSLINSLFGVVVSVEGPNESDLYKPQSEFVYNGHVGYPNATRAYGIDTYTVLKGNPATKHLPIGSPTCGYAANSYEMAPFYDYMDFEVFHPYAGGQAPSGMGLETWWKAGAIKMNGGNKTRPLQASECGYHTLWKNTNGDQPGVPESVQAKYMPRMWIIFYNSGLIRSYAYELFDQAGNDPTDSQQFYGIIRYNRTVKPVYYAIKNMISLLKDPNTKFTPDSLTYNHTGGATVMTTLFQKSNGYFYIAIWQEVSCFNISDNTIHDVSPKSVTLNISAPVTSYKVFKLSTSVTNPIASGTSSVITLSVPDELLFVEVIVGGVSSTTSVSTTGSFLDCTKYNTVMNWTFAGGDSLLVGSNEDNWVAAKNYVMMMASRTTISGGNLMLTLSNTGCPAQCNSLPYGTGGWMSAASYGYGTYTFTVKMPAVSGVYTELHLYSTDGKHDDIVLRFSGKDSKSVYVYWWANDQYVQMGTGNGIYSLGFDYSTDFHTYSFIYSATSVFFLADGKQITNETVAAAAHYPTSIQMSPRVWLMADPSGAGFGTFTYTGPITAQVKSLSFVQSSALPAPPSACILGSADYGLSPTSPPASTSQSTTSTTQSTTQSATTQPTTQASTTAQPATSQPATSQSSSPSSTTQGSLQSSSAGFVLFSWSAIVLCVILSM
eukprot:Phypoly_transcript_03644.p1 GENE.Phypoly_transcript_03644~~Phypoly_transcript_03644.p1  ORF type:complete len:786 (+),score=83.10 Phypoly_transcript_03644:182-2359(+)